MNEGLNLFRVDVPADEKNHRRELPHMQRTWLSHMSEHDDLVKDRPQLKTFLDLYRIRMTLWYRSRPCFKKEVKAILARVAPENWTLADRLAHAVPYSLQKLLLKCYRLLRKRP